MPRGLVDELSPKLLARLLEDSVRRPYSKRSTIFLDGESVHEVLLIESGLLKITKTAVSGRSLLLTLMGPGAFVGDLPALDDERRSANATAVSDTVVRSIPVNRFREILEGDIELALFIARSVTRRLRELSQEALDIGTGQASQRIATRLASLLTPANDDGHQLQLPITQTELAEWTGLSRESAVRALTALRDDGVVETGRGSITIVDPERLQGLMTS